MIAKTLLNDLLALPAIDREELVQRLWQSLETDQNAFPLTEEQVAELSRREAEMEADPTHGDSWENVKARIWPNP